MLDRAEALAHREPDVLRGHIVLEIDEGLLPRGIAIGRQFAAADAGRGAIALDRIAAWFSGTARLLCGRRAGRGAVIQHRVQMQPSVSGPGRTAFHGLLAGQASPDKCRLWTECESNCI